jgi:hypothetical protein
MTVQKKYCAACPKYGFIERQGMSHAKPRKHGLYTG